MLGSISTSTLPSIKLRKCSSKIITSILSFISGRLATKSNQIKQLIRNGRSASLQRTFKKSFTSFSHSTRNKTRDGLIRVRNRSEERRVGKECRSRRHTRSVSAFLLNRSSDLRKCSSKIITSILSFISGRLATKSNQIKQLIRNGRSASLQRTFKKSFTSFSHSTRNKTRDGLIRVRNIRALNGRFNTSITH